MTTRVVDVRSKEWEETPEEQRVYIGRAVYRGKHRFPASMWANRFVVGKEGSPDEVIAKHENYVRWMAWPYETFIEFRGKTLGCWCKAYKPRQKDKPCHGDLYVRLAEMTPEEYRQWLMGK